MDHNEIRHKLSEYIDDALSPEEKVSVEVHLKTCPVCSNALMELQKTVEHIRQIKEVDPPAWMTKRIMTGVRAEEKRKGQGLFGRLFFPLHVKLPLEAIGVLFIAVTVYFVVQDAQQARQGVPAAPAETSSAEPLADDRGTATDKAAGADARLKPEKKVPQEPGYKALDMKPAYDGPKKPERAPAPRKALPSDELHKSTVAPSREKQSLEQTEPGITRYRTPTGEFSDREAASQTPPASLTRKKAERFELEEMRAAAPLAEAGNRRIVTLVVPDTRLAAARVEEIIREYRGRILRKEPAQGVFSITAAVDAAGSSRIMERLESLGELKDKEIREPLREGTLLEIRMVRQVQRN